MLRRLLYRNFRLIYRFDNWARNRFTSMGAMLSGGLIGSGIFSVDTRQSLAFQIFSFLLALLLLAFFHLLSFRGKFRVRRILPEYATVRQPVQYKIIVENLGQHLQRDLELYDELQASLPAFPEFAAAQDPRDRSRNWFDRVIGYPRLINLMRKKRGASIAPVAIGPLPGHDRNEVILELMPHRRGYIHFVRTRVARPDPLGLLRAMKTSNTQEALLVLPRTYVLPPVQIQGRRKYQHGGMNQASAVGDAQEFMSLRDYQPGDPLRAIHWRSYAKTGHPVVKEYQDEFFVRKGLLLDTFIEDRPAAIFEEAVSLAASFVITDQPQDALLDLMFVGTESYRFTTGRGLGQLENMLEILACVEPCRQTVFSNMLELVLRHVHETSGILCILLDWDHKRQELIRRITSLDIPVVVLLITGEPGETSYDTTALGAYSGNFRVLHTGDIQSQLNRIGHI